MVVYVGMVNLQGEKGQKPGMLIKSKAYLRKKAGVLEEYKV